MVHSDRDLNELAERYLRIHGDEAYLRIAEDISKAIGQLEWDSAYQLQRAQWRVRKLERLRQITASLRLSRSAAPDSFAYSL
jgi:hypothetical protein